MRVNAQGCDFCLGHEGGEGIDLESKSLVTDENGFDRRRRNAAKRVKDDSSLIRQVPGEAISYKGSRESGDPIHRAVDRLIRVQRAAAQVGATNYR